MPRIKLGMNAGRMRVTPKGPGARVAVNEPGSNESRVYDVPRGVPVNVPDSVVDVLKNARLDFEQEGA